MDDMLLQIEPMIPALRRYARGLLRDQETADDIVQDCLERIIANWRKRRKDDARSWAFSILHNLAVNRLRQNLRRGATVPIDDLPEAVGALRATQEETVFGHEVMAEVESLPPDYRAVLLLISVEDMSYADAAKVLGIPLGTVMSRLSRAREHLRTRLGGAPQDGVRQPKPIPGNPYIRRVK